MNYIIHVEFFHFLVDVSILRKWNADGNYFVVRQNTVKPSNEDCILSVICIYLKLYELKCLELIIKLNRSC